MSYRAIRAFLAVGLFILLSGCGTPVSSGASSAEISQKAVVVFSISHDVEFGNGPNAIAYIDTESISARVVLKSVQDILSVPVSSDFTDRRGHLYVLEMSPGTHAFNAWQISYGRRAVFPDRFYQTSDI